MFKNQFGLYVRNFFSCGKSRHCQLTQMVGITGPDMNQEIYWSGDMIQLNHFGQTERMVSEGIDIRFVMTNQSDCDHGLNSNSKAGRINLCMKAGNDAGVLQKP